MPARTGRLEACPTCLPGFMAPTHAQFLEVFPLHEPPVRSSAFTRSEQPKGGTPNPLLRRFMAPTHVKILEVFALHERQGRARLSERAADPSQRRDEDNAAYRPSRLMASMHAKKRKK